jgi:hypothetical protein
MGEFYKIMESIGGNDEAKAMAQIIDDKLLKIQNDIDIAGFKNLYKPGTSDITRREYIERTDAIQRQSQAILDLARNLLSIEGVLKRSKMLS